MGKQDLQGHWRTGAEILWFPMQSATQRALRGVLCVFATTQCGWAQAELCREGSLEGCNSSNVAGPRRMDDFFTFSLVYPGDSGNCGARLEAVRLMPLAG